MAKIGLVIGQLHDSLMRLSSEYRKVGQRHASDHDVFHFCRQLSLECLSYAQQVIDANIHTHIGIAAKLYAFFFHNLNASVNHPFFQLEIRNAITK